MIKEVFKNIYQMTIPMPNTPLKALNSYVVKSPERNLIIDTCYDLPECFEATCSGLKKLDINLNKTDIFITHKHSDHSGLIRRLASNNSVIYCSEQDAQAINSTQSESVLVVHDFFLRAGFPANEAQKLLGTFSNNRVTRQVVEFKVVSNGDTISIGDYDFNCIVTPGHTSGHICLYEADKNFLVSGDHILNTMTPDISLLFIDDMDPLTEYLKSLDKLDKLDIETVLPGHMAVFNNCRERINQIKERHRIRNNEILDILELGTQNVYEIATQIYGDIQFNTFQDMQKFFVISESFAHLKYMETQKNVKREIRDSVIFYSLSERR